MKMKALLLGDYSLTPYHSLTGVDEKINNILNEFFDISVTDDYSLLSNELEDIKLIICYADRWNSALNDSEMGGLVSFVARGGGLIVLHNGISLGKRDEFKSMTGAWFTGHPESNMLPFQLVGEHPICMGITDFEMYEEPYQYGFCNHIEPEVFLYYQNEGKIFKSGWTNKFGEGKVVCLHPGHDMKSFENPSYNQIIIRSALWSVGCL